MKYTVSTYNPNLFFSVRKLGPITATPQSGAPGVDYVFSLPLAPGESITLVPSASSLLFTPLSAVVVGANDCVQGVVFKAERGQVSHNSRCLCLKFQSQIFALNCK